MSELSIDIAEIEVIALRIKAERDRYHAALVLIAAFNDESANGVLALTGSYAGFDEPCSVKFARDALAKEHGAKKEAA